MKQYRILSTTDDGKTSSQEELFATADPRAHLLVAQAVRSYVKNGVPKLRRPTPGNSRQAIVMGCADPAVFDRFAGRFVNPQKLFNGGVRFDSQADLARALGYEPAAFAVLLTNRRNSARRNGLPTPTEFVIRGLKVRLNDRPTISVT